MLCSVSVGCMVEGTETIDFCSSPASVMRGQSSEMEIQTLITHKGVLQFSMGT